ncbi:MAG: DUF4838 domain-containing protein [Planctomycetota bacterium]|nr:DUF4838 domain-containing protein [Planctomycetota bacterium]
MYKQPSAKLTIGAILVVTFAVQTNAAAERLSLVQAGRPSATIVLPNAPTQIEKSASLDLQRCLKRMSGAALPIVAESEQPQGVRVEIGRTEQGRRLRKELSQAKHRSEETCVIKVTEQSILLVGRNDAATGHAVYALLEQLGVRWLQPSLAWEIVPRKKTVSVQTGRHTLAPYFDRRGGLAVSPNKMDANWRDSMQSWARRNRMGGWDHIGNGHSYQSIVHSDRFKDHPEYFGLWQGRRHRLQLCTTHPDVIRRAIERARDDWCKNSDARLVCISPNDGNQGFCECVKCAKLRFAPHNHSDLILELANQVARAIRDKHPERFVTFYADYHCVGPPLKVKPEKNIVFWIPQWNVDRAQPLTHPRQKRFRDAIESWSQFGNPIHLYLYYTSYNHWLYYPLTHCFRVDFPHFVKNGVRGVYSQSQPNWGTQGLNLYLYSRLAWDPALDVDELVAEFCELAYGPASQTMLRYYKLLEETAASGTYYTTSDVVGTFGPRIVDQADRLMARAVQQVEAAVKDGADPDLLKRIQYVERAQRVVALHLRARHAMNRFFKSRNRELLNRAQRNYEEEIKILSRPENEYLIDANFRKKLISRLAVLKSRTVYGVGRFRYSDGFSGGGNSAIHSKHLAGFFPGQWGLNLPPRGSGQIIYRFEASDGGVFKTAVLTSPKIAFEKDMLSNAIEIRTPETGDKRFVRLARNQDLENAKRDFDLTKTVAGMPWFELRISARNRSTITRLSLLSLGVRGEVIKKKD